jgi:hypothetical protein
MGTSLEYCLGAQLISRIKIAINYCKFAYSALACLRMGMSGSASFHRVRKSLAQVEVLAYVLADRLDRALY